MPENFSIRTTLGQYFIQKKIAQGGMAEIFKGIASDIHGMKRTVCIKKILPHIAANKEFVDMLVSEAKIAVELNHGNIAQIYDLGKAGQDYFIVMEYVDGRSLSQIHKRCLKEGRLIPLEYVCFLISEVASGLDYMHHRTDAGGRPLGIVHRDISPQNLIVSFSGTIKIIDFGIAKSSFKLDYTESGVLKGKFAYMSPEQARGEDIDGRSDIFSLGVILHELISGRRLFKDKDNRSTIRNVRRADVHPPSSYNPEVPKELDEITMKALAKDVQKRYQRAGDMRDDLLRFLHSRYPDFKPSMIIDFILGLFGNELETDDEEKEKENTPILMVDQTQPAIDLAVPHLMKEFMLEEPGPEKAVKNENEEKRPEDKMPEGPSFKKRTVLRLKSLWSPVSNYLPMAIVLLGIAALTYATHRLGWWQKWSDFFRAEELHRVEKRTPALKYTKLIIDSDPPGARLFIDDIQTNLVTPVTIDDFKADGRSHTIGFYLDKYNYLTLTFTAVPDETIRMNPRLDMSYGELLIISDPEGANVLLNGEIVGKTPFKKERIEPRTIFKVAVALDGYTPFGEDIMVNANKASVLRVSLMRLPSRTGQFAVPIPKLSGTPQPAVEPKRPPRPTEKIFMLPDTSEAALQQAQADAEEAKRRYEQAGAAAVIQEQQPQARPVTESASAATEQAEPAQNVQQAQKTEISGQPAPAEEPKASFSLTEIPLMPAQPVAPPPQSEITPNQTGPQATQTIEQPPTGQQQLLPVPQIFHPSAPGAPAPESRDKKFELDY